ncbi:transcriptional regulator [Lysinibacillus alkalisoli]|uniref:Transcriptional regulator n=1 Tax=Lysinibacillus alkalisoli TaxID=1911548 RepID=A0A917G7K1_9BACI|nr:DUF4188 domain-containing protein [Lysinibacillus alkalisoli]GGG26233.1 transcriptional regulator [Lysinibacillus alkalisoli]
MSKVTPGRFTTENKEDIVVFLIGMRINQYWKPHKWLPVFASMPPLIKELYQNKEALGFLSMESYFGLRTSVMIQYWRSIDHLHAYAHQQQHLQAWKNFMQRVGKSNSVGIYHETYPITSGQYESVFSNMNDYGLAKALPKIPITASLHTAKQRLQP